MRVTRRCRLLQRIYSMKRHIRSKMIEGVRKTHRTRERCSCGRNTDQYPTNVGRTTMRGSTADTLRWFVKPSAVTHTKSLESLSLQFSAFAWHIGLAHRHLTTGLNHPSAMLHKFVEDFHHMLIFHMYDCNAPRWFTMWPMHRHRPLVISDRVVRLYIWISAFHFIHIALASLGVYFIVRSAQ